MRQITCLHCADTYPDFDVAHVCSKGPYAPRLKPKMNERIQELMAEVGMSVDYLTNTKQIVLIEKFAELIVRQMLDITDAHTEVFQTDRDRALIKHIKQSVKQHFGVEE